MNIVTTNIKSTIENAYDNRSGISALSADEKQHLLSTLGHVIADLDRGYYRVAEKINGEWHTHQWLKKAILLNFILRQNEITHDTGLGAWYDKIPTKTASWDQSAFEQAAFRAVPGAIIRYGAHIESGAILMPSFINIGARVDKGTLIDTWSTIGSCAQIGSNCHISGGVGIGGVLEPLQANPVIIEDNCFIGARSEIAEGVIVEEGSVISMGVFLGASTKIIDRSTGEIFMGKVPAYSVVVPGVMPSLSPAIPQLACAVIVKRVDAKTRSKTAINDLLRD